MKKKYICIPLDRFISAQSSWEDIKADDSKGTTSVLLRGNHVIFPGVFMSDEEMAQFKLPSQSTDEGHARGTSTEKPESK